MAKRQISRPVLRIKGEQGIVLGSNIEDTIHNHWRGIRGGLDFGLPDAGSGHRIQGIERAVQSCRSRAGHRPRSG